MEHILAIDLGAQRIKAAVACKDENGELEILGLGTADTDGFANGYVQDMEALSNKIYSALLELQKDWQDDINPFKMPIFYSVSGEHLSSRNIETEMRLVSNIDPETKEGKISQEDIDTQKRELETFASDVLPKGMRKIGIILQCYQVDKKLGIKNPKEMHGRDIRAAGLLITDAQSHIFDLENAIIKALMIDFGNIEKKDLQLIPVAASIASATAVLSKEQNENGVAILDIGRGCCDLSVFYKEKPVFIWSKDYAGEEITMEIKKFLTISYDEAESIKKEYAYASPVKAGQKESIEISEGRVIALDSLAQWVYDPIKHMFGDANNSLDGNIDRTTYKKIISQVVLTGGTANLKEIAFVAQEVFGLPVKTGKPNAVKINGNYSNIQKDMSFATLIGLCAYGIKNYVSCETAVSGRKKTYNTRKIKNVDNKVGNFVKEWWEAFKNIKFK